MHISGHANNVADAMSRQLWTATEEEGSAAEGDLNRKKGEMW